MAPERSPPREALTFSDAFRAHNVIRRRPEAQRPTGEQAFDHAARDIARMIRGNYAPVILVHGEGEYGTGLGITKSTLCIQFAERVQSVLSQELELGLPSWIDENESTDFQIEVADPGDWRQVAYTSEDISRYRAYARSHRGRPYLLVFDEPTLGMLSNEANKPAGIYLYQELQTCRNDNVTVFLAMAKWWKLTGAILDQIPYSAALPAQLRGEWHKRRTHAMGVDYEKRKEKLEHYPVRVCQYHPGGPWTEFTFPFLRRPIFDRYEAQKNRRRDAALHDKRMAVFGREQKDIHEGESQEAIENEITIAKHLLQWSGPQHCDLCTRTAAVLPPRKGAKVGRGPTWREIQSLYHIGARAMQIANQRSRAEAAAGAGRVGGAATQQEEVEKNSE